MKLKAWLPAIAMAAVAFGGGGVAHASTLTSPSASPPASTTATIDSPIGPITDAENTYLHTHPVNMTAFDNDPTYKSEALANLQARVPNTITPNEKTATSASQLTYWGFFCTDGTLGCMNNWNG